MDRFGRDRLFGLKSARPTRLAHGEALIRRTASGDWLNPYITFMADAHTDLTSWLISDGDRRTRTVNLDPFDRFPVLRTGSGQMVWARVVKTCITYVKSGVSFTQTRYLGETQVKVGVTFPKQTSSRANVVITLKETPVAYVGCRIHAVFDGESIAPVGIEQLGQFKGPGSEITMLTLSSEASRSCYDCLSSWALRYCSHTASTEVSGSHRSLTITV